MRTRRHGDIVNISSLGGLVAFAATGYYHANKFDCPFSRKTITKTCARVGMEKSPARSTARDNPPPSEAAGLGRLPAVGTIILRLTRNGRCCDTLTSLKKLLQHQS
jgi:hypothetical protein